MSEMTSVQEERVEVESPTVEADPDATKAAFVAACIAHLTSERNRSAEEIAEAKNLLAKYSAEIVEQTRRLQLNRIRMASLEAWEGQEAVRLAADFEKILQLKDIRKAVVAEGGVSVYTDTMYVESMDHLYEVGEFRINISLDGEVSVVNLKNRGQDPRYDHPHIREGIPCFGNIREGLAKLIGQFELATATALVLSYLQTYNQADAMISIKHWPEVDRNR